MNDKRRFLRFDAALNMEFKPRGSDGKYYLGLLKNFSRQGLNFVSHKFEGELPKDLDLKLKLPAKDVVVPCLGEVAWKQNADNETMVGIKLKEMNTASKAELLEYLYKKWVEKSGQN